MKSLNIKKEEIEENKDEILFVTICKLKKIIPLYFVKKNEFTEITEFVKNLAQSLSLTIRFYSIEHSSLDKGLTNAIAETNIKCSFIGETWNDKHETKAYTITTGKFPPMLRVRPILSWKYSDVWKFLKDYKCQYCTLYDKGYTSIGTKDNTIPNPALLIESTGEYLPAYMLMDELKERAGRLLNYNSSTKL